MRVLVIGICFVAFLLVSFTFSSTVPKCTSPFCCNYCNATYSFPNNNCDEVLNALILSAESTEYFSYNSSVANPPSVYIVHTTISDCCPPGYTYYEDVMFNMTSNEGSSSCDDVVGFSISRDGTCDLGNDEVNLNTLVVNTGFHFTGPVVNSGCELSG